MQFTPVKQTLKTLLLPPYCHWRYGDLGKYMVQARLIEGWTTFDELEALADTCQTLPENPVVVEIGSFLGRSAVILAGCCKLRGSGQVHCIDPFDGSGDSFSVPVYQSIANTLSTSLQDRFAANIKRAGLENWVTLHKGTAETIAQNWSAPIDMLFLDGDQSPAGVQSAYQSWMPEGVTREL
jgi:Methyltransferase domain